MMSHPVLVRLVLRSAFLLGLFAALYQSTATAAEDPSATLRSSVEEVLTIAYSSQNSATIASRVRPALTKIFAFELVTRQAIGPGWRQFSASDQKKVTDLFSQLMIRIYSARVVGSQRPTITYGNPVALAAERTEISSRVAFPNGSPVSVIYRMIKLAEGWRIYDVLIEGVSFVANYRAQFDDLVKRGGAPAVIQTLETKLASPITPRS